jgi:hypothetical protein
MVSCQQQQLSLLSIQKCPTCSERRLCFIQHVSRFSFFLDSMICCSIPMLIAYTPRWLLLRPSFPVMLHQGVWVCWLRLLQIGHLPCFIFLLKFILLFPLDSCSGNLQTMSCLLTRQNECIVSNTSFLFYFE